MACIAKFVLRDACLCEWVSAHYTVFITQIILVNRFNNCCVDQTRDPSFVELRVQVHCTTGPNKYTTRNKRLALHFPPDVTINHLKRYRNNNIILHFDLVAM